MKRVIFFILISLLTVSTSLRSTANGIRDSIEFSIQSELNHFYSLLPSELTGAPFLLEKSISFVDIRSFDGAQDAGVMNTNQFPEALLALQRGYTGLSNFKNLLGNPNPPGIALHFVDEVAATFLEKGKDEIPVTTWQTLKIVNDQLVPVGNWKGKLAKQAVSFGAFSMEDLPTVFDFVLNPVFLNEAISGASYFMEFDGSGVEEEVEIGKPTAVSLAPGKHTAVLTIRDKDSERYINLEFNVVGQQFQSPMSFDYRYSDPLSNAEFSVVFSDDSKTDMDNLVIFVEGLDNDDAMNAGSFLARAGYGEPGSFVELLRENGFDIGFLDFGDDNNLSMRYNAASLTRLLNQLNAGDYTGKPMTIVGVDMGAIIARYSLALLERDCINHGVGKYYSFDGPHNGLNFPVSLQFMLKSFDNIGNKDLIEWISGEAEDHADFLNSPAWKELLINHHYNQSGAWESHDIFYEELEELGMPRNTKNSAITLGNTRENTLAFSTSAPVNSGNPAEAHARLFSVHQSPSKSGILVDCYAKALSDNPLGNNHKIAKARFEHRTVLELRLFGERIRLTKDIEIYHRNFDYFNRSAADLQPGAYEFFQKSIADGYNDRKDGNLLYAPASNPSSRYTSTFIPAQSALALTEPYREQRFVDKSFSELLSEGISQFDEILYNTESNNHWHQEGFTGDIPIDLIEVLLATLVDDLLGFKKLPTNLNQEFNFTQIHGPEIDHVTIEKDGVLYLNANKPSGFLVGDYPANGSKLNVDFQGGESEVCGVQSIRVATGGNLVLGDAVQDNAANLTLPSDGVLEVESGGTVTLYNDSRIALSGNARLILHRGAHVQLVGSETEVIIEGETSLMGDGQGVTISGAGVFQANQGEFSFGARNPLNVEGACQVVLGPETNLGLNDAANVWLNGDQARVEIQGRLTLANEAVWSNVSDGGTTGYYVLNPQEEDFITLEGISSVLFSGEGKHDRILEVKSDAVFPGGLGLSFSVLDSYAGDIDMETTGLEATGMSSVHFQDGEIAFSPPVTTSILVVKSNGSAENVRFVQTTEGNGRSKFKIDGVQGYVVRDFEADGVMLWAESNGGTAVVYFMEGSLNNSSIETQGYAPQIQTMNLKNKSTIQLDAIFGVVTNIIEVDGDTDAFVWLEGTGDAAISRCHFSNSLYPIRTRTAGMVSLACNEFENVEGAIEFKNSSLNMGMEYGRNEIGCVGENNAPMILGLEPLNNHGAIHAEDGGNLFNNPSNMEFAFWNFNSVAEDCNNDIQNGNQWGASAFSGTQSNSRFNTRIACPNSNKIGRIVDPSPISFEKCPALKKPNTGNVLTALKSNENLLEGIERLGSISALNRLKRNMQEGDASQFLDLESTYVPLLVAERDKAESDALYTFKTFFAVVDFLLAVNKQSVLVRMLENQLCLWGVDAPEYENVFDLIRFVKTQNHHSLGGFGTLHYSEEMGLRFPLCSSTSVEIAEDASPSKLVVYPNPSQHSFTIQSMGAAITKVRMCNMVSRECHQISVPKLKSTQVFGADLAKGLYLLEVEMENGEIEMHKMLRK